LARIHPTAEVERGAIVGKDTVVWRHAHVMKGARIGARCMLGQGTFVGAGARLGDGCRIQNHVSIYGGVELDDDVFVGPSAVFTNVKRPRAAYPQKPAYETTRVGRGATIGANATIVSGVTIGAHAFIGAGAVITRDIPDHALVVGAPGRIGGWICACGEKIARAAKRPRSVRCSVCGIGPSRSG
jgi:UDP-2-acetamido-3-amino-2,3-dideoxy-glucuronate N-acetyltransferase